MPDLEWSVQDGIATLLLNRPARKNAFTFEMVEQWAAHLHRAQADDAVRAVILTGAGDSFCSGVDLGSISSGSTELTALQRKSQLHDVIHRVALAVDALDKPLIAAVNGAAIGAGMDMALMCDMRVASRTARFSEGYVRLGLVPGDGGAYYLPRLVGMAKALELLLSADVVVAAEALRVGLVNQVADDALHTATELARRIAAHPPVTVRMIKRLAHQSATTDLRTALDLASSHFAVVAATDDAAEALAAFRERRTPTYQGR